MQTPTKPTLFAVRLIGLLLIASNTFAAPVPFRNGAELEKQIKAGATELAYTGQRGSEIYLDRENVFTKAAGTINFNGAAVKVRVPNHAGAFKADGGKLYLVDYASFTQSKNWLAIADNGGEILCRKFEHNGTRGVFGIEGVLNLISGKSTTREYGIYAGSIDRGDRATVKVYAQDVDFSHDHEKFGESPVRLMGAWGDFVRCTFTTPPLTKESQQARYGVPQQKTTFTRCTFKYNLSLRPLRAGEAGKSEEEKYRRYAAKVPLLLEFIGCTIHGYSQIEGNTRAKFIDCTFTGPDPRGIGGTNTAINTGWAWGIRAKVEAIRCTFGVWKNAGDDGVAIKP